MKLAKEILENHGFVEEHSNVFSCAYTIDLGRNRVLVVSNPGTPNEMLFIEDISTKPNIDVVTLWNYDYDGYLTFDRLGLIYFAITNKTLKNSLESYGFDDPMLNK